MTKEEVQKKNNDKRIAIEIFCKQMQVVISAEQMITENGFIKNVVFYNNIEKYDVDEKLNEKTNENIKKDAPILRGKKSKDSVRMGRGNVRNSKGKRNKTK